METYVPFHRADYAPATALSSQRVGPCPGSKRYFVAKDARRLNAGLSCRRKGTLTVYRQHPHPSPLPCRERGTAAALLTLSTRAQRQILSRLHCTAVVVDDLAAGLPLPLGERSEVRGTQTAFSRPASVVVASTASCGTTPMQASPMLQFGPLMPIWRRETRSSHFGMNFQGFRPEVGRTRSQGNGLDCGGMTRHAQNARFCPRIPASPKAKASAHSNARPACLPTAKMWSRAPA